MWKSTNDRDALGDVIDSIRLEDVIGDDGITDNNLDAAQVIDFESDLSIM